MVGQRVVGEQSRRTNCMTFFLSLLLRKISNIENSWLSTFISLLNATQYLTRLLNITASPALLLTQVLFELVPDRLRQTAGLGLLPLHLALVTGHLLVLLIRGRLLVLLTRGRLLVLLVTGRLPVLNLSLHPTLLPTL